MCVFAYVLERGEVRERQIRTERERERENVRKLCVCVRERGSDRKKVKD